MNGRRVTRQRSLLAALSSQTLGFLIERDLPTVLRIGGLRVTVYPNDHPPPHAHVVGAKGEAVFLLNCPNGPPELRESFGFNGSEVGRMANTLSIHIAALCHEWDVIHGSL